VGQAQPKKILSITPKTDSPTTLIKNRQTEELVIGLCGSVGSGISTVGRAIAKALKKHRYQVSIEKVTDHIIALTEPIPDGTPVYERISKLQYLGNDLRSNNGDDFLSQQIIWTIADKRHQAVADKLGIKKEDLDYRDTNSESWRHVTIIDSLKNPAEVELLNLVYGHMFYLFGVLCDDDERRTRLTKKGQMKPHEALLLMEKDKQEKDSNGQQVIKTLQLSDFFVRNNNRESVEREPPIDRFTQLILRQNNITPTIEEYGMFMAESAAKLSGCMSRQVGAAILSKDGEIISTGRNDVPSPRGGLYWENKQHNDCRCLHVEGHECENYRSKELIYKKIENLISDKFSNVKDGKNDEQIDSNTSNIIKFLKSDSEIKDLLEYSKAVHAEMDAITTAARVGGRSLKDTVLYSTTFPCHHCARHIVASGIKTVYYIEPYEKSLAKRLHDDSITLGHENPNGAKNSDQVEKVQFLHFEGVAPKQYLHLFTCNDRKENGRLKEIDLSTQKPASVTYLDNFVDRESKIVESLASSGETNPPPEEQK
jgi:deoxycytidylate deaminase